MNSNQEILILQDDLAVLLKKFKEKHTMVDFTLSDHRYIHNVDSQDVYESSASV